MHFQKSDFRGGEGYSGIAKRFFTLSTPNFFWEDFRMYERTWRCRLGLQVRKKIFFALRSSKNCFFSHFEYLSEFGSAKLRFRWSSKFWFCYKQKINDFWQSRTLLNNLKNVFDIFKIISFNFWKKFEPSSISLDFQRVLRQDG